MATWMYAVAVIVIIIIVVIFMWYTGRISSNTSETPKPVTKTESLTRARLVDTRTASDRRRDRASGR
jgi:hypothetical protein